MSQGTRSRPSGLCESIGAPIPDRAKSADQEISSGLGRLQNGGLGHCGDHLGQRDKPRRQGRRAQQIFTRYSRSPTTLAPNTGASGLFAVSCRLSAMHDCRGRLLDREIAMKRARRPREIEPDSGPPAVRRARVGVEIGRAVGSRVTAACTPVRVIVDDLMSDPKGAPYRGRGRLVAAGPGSKQKLPG